MYIFRDSGPNGVFILKDKNTILEEFSKTPRLSELRSMERQHGSPTDRIDLWNKGFSCSGCGSEIEGRFSADNAGNLLCWSCVKNIEKSGISDKIHVPDPTKSVLSGSSISLCDYVINVATGCMHGCRFCYVPNTPAISARGDMIQNKTGKKGGKDWGNYILYRDDLPERLSRKLENKQKWKRSNTGEGSVLLSSGTDPYQDKRTAQISRGCIAELIKHDKPVRILTRSPLALRDIDLYGESDQILVGFSIPSRDDSLVRAIEPGAPPPSSRIRALKRLGRKDIRRYVCISPTYPNMVKKDIQDLLEEIKKVEPEAVFHETINHRGNNIKMTASLADKSGKNELANSLRRINDIEEWLDYSLNHIKWMEEICEKMGLDLYIRIDKKLIRKTSELYPDRFCLIEKHISNPEKEYFN